MGQSGDDTALAGRLRAFRVEGEGRDTVQPCLQRQEDVFKARALTDIVQLVQRNRLIFGERTGLRAAQEGDVANRAERVGNVARQAADIGALADFRPQRDRVRQF